MNFGPARQFTCCLAVFALSAVSLFAQTDQAILNAGKDVTLNGNSVHTSAAVMQGDRVHTGNDPTLLFVQGTRVQVGANSALTFGHTLDLACGAVVVSTSKATAVHTEQLTATPDSAAATTFAVTNAGGKIEVKVDSGQVFLKDEAGTTTLGAGQSATRNVSSSCPVPKGKVGVPASAAVHGVSGKTIGVVTGVAGAGALAAVMATRDKGTPPSPSHP